ncbi:MAG: molybdopterin molybdotransferase MoeA, partial [Deltaproteobacteria bacterium]|nr:molybdopterin molybdotransferase MoeA [Deltaproteobacteria bacterium]
MHGVSAAQQIVLAAARPLGIEEVPRSQASGRWLARPIAAPGPVPAFACSAMDGWAVRTREAALGARLKVGKRLFAGDLPGAELGPWEAARIFTGAPLPEGADAVVCEELGEESEGTVGFRRPPLSGENVRRAGEDVAAGALALPAGMRLGPRQCGLCTALGLPAVPVVARPRVALISTGDEIARGLIPDSNGAAIQGALEALGCLVQRGTAPDDPEEIALMLTRASERSDVVITTAGVSVGEKDCVPRALERLGAQILIHGVALKPGKPFLFARAGDKPVLGLPGSPSACLAAFEIFARPFLLSLAGASRVRRRSLWLALAAPVTGRAGRARVLWAVLDEEGRVRPLGHDTAQISGPAR